MSFLLVTNMTLQLIKLGFIFVTPKRRKFVEITIVKCGLRFCTHSVIIVHPTHFSWKEVVFKFKDTKICHTIYYTRKRIIGTIILLSLLYVSRIIGSYLSFYSANIVIRGQYSPADTLLITSVFDSAVKYIIWGRSLVVMR